MQRNTDIQVVWFKRDLRVVDHRALARAAEVGPVLPLYMVEPGLWAQADMSGRHWTYISSCLEDLREALSRQGQTLIVRVGEAIDVFEALHLTHGIAAL